MKMEDYVRYAATQLSQDLKTDAINYAPIIKAFDERPRSGITIVASGSSYNSSLMVVDAMEQAMGLPVCLETPEHANTYLAHSKKTDFIIVISQSGESTNIIQCIKTFREENIDFYLLTGNMDSRAAHLAASAQDYGAGNEYVDFVTVGVQTLVLFLLRFAERVKNLRSSDIYHWSYEKAVDAQELVLNHTDRFIAVNKMGLSESVPTFFVGTGPNFGVAKEGALKFQETLKRPAMYYEVEEFLHGPDMQLTPDHAVFLIDDLVPNERVVKIFGGLQLITDKVYLITSSTHFVHDTHVITVPKAEDWELEPLLTLPPIQLIASVMAESLNRWDTHPYFGRFDDMVAIKEDDYQQQLKNIRTRWNEQEGGNK